MIEYSTTRPVLFLDVDGCLNRHEPICDHVVSGVIRHDLVDALNFVLEPTDAQIVLSSAWRYLVHREEMNVAGLSWLLRSHGIYNRLVGITRADTMKVAATKVVWTADLWKSFPTENERGQQITDWLREHDHRSRYAVVDDLDLGIRAAGHPFVQTDGSRGITENDAYELIRLLGRKETDL